MPERMTANPETNPELFKEPYVTNRAQVQPNGIIEVYRINSSDIEYYINQKVAAIVPGSRAEVQPQYIERKGSSRNPADKRSYAALIVALSSDVIQEKAHNDIFRQMVEQDIASRRIDDKVYSLIVQKYGYSKDKLIEYTKSYKQMDRYYEQYGITEEYIKNLIKWSTPRRQQSTSKETWVIFAARPHMVIRDMLTECTVHEPIEPSEDITKMNLQKAQEKYKFRFPDDESWGDLSDDQKRQYLPRTIISNKRSTPAGPIEIVEYSRVSKDNVEFLVHLHRDETYSSDNPELRKLMKSIFD